MPQEDPAAFLFSPHETAQACACGNVGKVTVITQDPSLQIVRVTTHEKDLLFVVCFQKKKIRIGDLLEDPIRDAAYICDDTGSDDRRNKWKIPPAPLHRGEWRKA